MASRRPPPVPAADSKPPMSRGPPPRQFMTGRSKPLAGKPLPPVSPRNATGGVPPVVSPRRTPPNTSGDAARSVISPSRAKPPVPTRSNVKSPVRPPPRSLASASTGTASKSSSGFRVAAQRANQEGGVAEAPPPTLGQYGRAVSNPALTKTIKPAPVAHAASNDSGQVSTQIGRTHRRQNSSGGNSKIERNAMRPLPKPAHGNSSGKLSPEDTSRNDARLLPTPPKASDDEDRLHRVATATAAAMNKRKMSIHEDLSPRLLSDSMDPPSTGKRRPAPDARTRAGVSRRQRSGATASTDEDQLLLEASGNVDDDAYFPIRVRLPNGRFLLLICAKTATAIQFKEQASSRLKTYFTNSVDQLQFSWEDSNDVISETAVMFESPFVQYSISQNKTPILQMWVTGARASKRKPTMTDEHKRIAFAEFRMQALLPHGKNIVVKCRLNMTLAEAKEVVADEARKQNIDFKPDRFKIREIVGGKPTRIFEDESLIVGDLASVDSARHSCTIPRFQFLPKFQFAFTPAEMKRLEQVSRFISKPVVTQSSDEEEVTHFREVMAYLRYLERERKRKELSKKKTTGGQRFSLRVVNTPLTDPTASIMASITLPLKEVKKTVKVMASETANLLLMRIFEKHYARQLPNKTPDDFVFKVVGLTEYIYGDHPFQSFEYVREKMTSNEKVDLVLLDKADATGLQDDLGHVMEEAQESPQLSPPAEINYDHNHICRDAPWDEKTMISTWELDQHFKIKILGVEGLSAFCSSFARMQSESGWSLYVAAGLYCGGACLGEVQKTEPMPLDSYPRWMEELEFSISISDLPAGTRLCVTLFGTRKADTVNEVKEVKHREPVAWVNCQLFNFKRLLRMGVVHLRMWPDEKANPIGTCVQNSGSQAPQLVLHFDEYQLPVVFPTHPLYDANSTEPMSVPSPDDAARVDTIISKDPLYPLTRVDKDLLWRSRSYCATIPQSLPKLLSSVAVKRADRREMDRLLLRWKLMKPIEALELLDSRFADESVREYAVRCLQQFSDRELQTYLLQLVQVLKYESYHDSHLARFLCRRALRSRRVGHILTWYLKSEMHVHEIAERYGLLLEAYLLGCGTHLAELKAQNEMMTRFISVAKTIKTQSEKDRKEVLIRELKSIRMPAKAVGLPLDPTLEVKGLLLNKCKYMDSKKVPLWLVFENADEQAKPVYTIFKEGDDLRQDMLTLQILKIMDKIWKNKGLDLQLSPYGCQATGDEIGFIEVVLNAETCANITKTKGGARAAFKASPIAKWLQENNPSSGEYEAAVNRFTLSCAGYCVATYVLGIGDRHNDNIMVQRSGRLFHIDFGHFLGNFKKKFGIKRERAKFVFTPDFLYVMGGKGSKHYQLFVESCCKAYNILRQHASLFVNLFAMFVHLVSVLQMLSTGIPELTKPSDIEYMREAFRLDLDSDQASVEFTKLINESLNTVWTQLNNAIHIAAH